MFEGIKDLLGINQRKEKKESQQRIDTHWKESELQFEVDWIIIQAEGEKPELDHYPESVSTIAMYMRELKLKTYPYDLTYEFVLGSITNTETLTLERIEYNEK